MTERSDDGANNPGGPAATGPACPPGNPVRVWIARAEAFAVLTLACVFVAWVAVIVVQQSRAGRGVRFVPAAQDAGEGLIDLNEAGVPELTLLPGIGRARAERIVNWRAQHGPFRTLDDVRKAAGISAGALDGTRPMVTLGGAAPVQPPDTAPDESDTE